MTKRPYWCDRILSTGDKRNIVWLSGVRRVGKTTLTKQIPKASYFNCDLPSVRRQLSDPEYFLANRDAHSFLILDEVHRLDDPSALLKIAADEFPKTRIIATGSSTLAATKKFRDSLTGRKRIVTLPPVLWRECLADFDQRNLNRRLLHGGFPSMLLETEPDGAFFEEWIDSFFARDIQELFAIRNRPGFKKLLNLVFLQSGGQLDTTKLAKQSGMSRPTVMAHLDAMEIAHAIFRLPPYHSGSASEIVKQPKAYGFDTGIIAHVRGWNELRESDLGPLWEHLVLDELRSVIATDKLHYWRDKSHHEIDFIIERSRNKVDAVEAKINPSHYSAESLLIFRKSYPSGRNFVVVPHLKVPYSFRTDALTITVCRPDQVEGAQCNH